MKCYITIPHLQCACPLPSACCEPVTRSLPCPEPWLGPELCLVRTQSPPKQCPELKFWKQQSPSIALAIAPTLKFCCKQWLSTALSMTRALWIATVSLVLTSLAMRALRVGELGLNSTSNSSVGDVATCTSATTTSLWGESRGGMWGREGVRGVWCLCVTEVRGRGVRELGLNLKQLCGGCGNLHLSCNNLTAGEAREWSAGPCANSCYNTRA